MQIKKVWLIFIYSTFTIAVWASPSPPSSIDQKNKDKERKFIYEKQILTIDSFITFIIIIIINTPTIIININVKIFQMFFDVGMMMIFIHSFYQMIKKIWGTKFCAGGGTILVLIISIPYTLLIIIIFFPLLKMVFLSLTFIRYHVCLPWIERVIVYY